jgi:hypothetical protein
LLQQATELLSAAHGEGIEPGLRLLYLAEARVKIFAVKDVVDQLELTLKAMEAAFAPSKPEAPR